MKASALWKELIILFWPIFGIFWCPVVTLVTFSSNLGNLKKSKKNPKISKNFKKLKNLSKIPKIPKIKKKSKKNPKKNLSKIQKSMKNPTNKKSVYMVKNPKILKDLKNSFFQQQTKIGFFLPTKKCYPLIFPILGGCDSIKALQSNPFQKYKIF